MNEQLDLEYTLGDVPTLDVSVDAVPYETNLRAQLEQVTAERDAAIQECRKRKGIGQDLQHYRERAEQAEADARALATYADVRIHIDREISQEHCDMLAAIIDKYLEAK